MARTEDAGLPQPQEGGRTGAAQGSLLAKSPTLQAGLAQARREGIVVQWGSAGEGTYFAKRRSWRAAWPQHICHDLWSQAIGGFDDRWHHRDPDGHRSLLRARYLTRYRRE